MTLNLEQLREDVVRLYGAKQWGLLSPCLYSIIDRKFYARFHFQEGMRLLKKFLNNKDDQNILIMLILNADREQYEEFYLRCKQAKAHVVACMQSMHALSDTLGHAVYFATGQNLDAKIRLKSREITLKNVYKALMKLDPTATEIEGLTRQLIEHSDYQYLADVVNHSKHRRIIEIPFSVSISESANLPYGLQLEVFEHDGKVYQREWVEPFLEREYNRQADLVIQVCEAMNRWVKNKNKLTKK